MKVAVTATREILYHAEVIHEMGIHTFTSVARFPEDESRSVGFRAEREAMERRKALKELRASIAKALDLPIEEVVLV